MHDWWNDYAYRYSKCTLSFPFGPWAIHISIYFWHHIFAIYPDRRLRSILFQLASCTLHSSGRKVPHLHLGLFPLVHMLYSNQFPDLLPSHISWIFAYFYNIRKITCHSERVFSFLVSFLFVWYLLFPLACGCFALHPSTLLCLYPWDVQNACVQFVEGLKNL